MSDNGSNRVALEKKLPELDGEVLVGSADQELGVLQHSLDCPRSGDGLRLQAGTVAIVDAVVPSLEYLPETILKLLEMARFSVFLPAASSD